MASQDPTPTASVAGTAGTFGGSSKIQAASVAAADSGEFARKLIDDVCAKESDREVLAKPFLLFERKIQ